jgi:hypothetical protein
LSALVFDDVVKQCGDGLVLVSAVLEHKRGDAKQMGHIRHVVAFATLMPVNADGIVERSVEMLAKLRMSNVQRLTMVDL